MLDLDTGQWISHCRGLGNLCRILVIGLCRQLMELGLCSSSHSNSTLLEEEVESAGMIAMSAQFADLLREPVPMGAFLAIVPIQTSFGSWSRL
jgi:hypothetical protein